MLSSAAASYTALQRPVSFCTEIASGSAALGAGTAVSTYVSSASFMPNSPANGLMAAASHGVPVSVSLGSARSSSTPIASVSSAMMISFPSSMSLRRMALPPFRAMLRQTAAGSVMTTSVPSP